MTMPRMLSLFHTAASVALILCSGALWANGPGIVDADGTGVSWASLQYGAAVSVARTDASIAIGRLAAREAASDLIPAASGKALEPATDDLLVLSLDTVVKGGLFSTKRYQGRVWFEPGDGRSLQRSRLREGPDGNLRVYRYTEEGVFRLRLEPRDKQESKGPPMQWGSRREAYFPFDPGEHGCATIVDSAALLYLVTRERQLSERPHQTICVFNKRELYRVSITPTGTEILDVSFTVTGTDGVREIAGDRTTFKIRLEPKLLGKEPEDAEPFEFLGLEGTIHLFVDQQLGIPVRVTGYGPRVGEGALDLVRAALVGSSRPD